jgi:type I restriction enzyme S subunit
VPFYRAREIVKLSKYGVVRNELYITETLFKQLSGGGQAPEPGDVMITGVGTIGVPYVVKASDRFYFKDASVLIFKNRYRLNPDFLSLFMQSPYWVRRIHEESMGTTVDTLTISRASEVVVPLPPLAEQDRIVARVEQLRRLCADLRERLQRARATQSRLADALVSTAAQSPSC